jgi:hypothetical protein
VGCLGSPKLLNVIKHFLILITFATATLGATLAVPAGGDLQNAINSAAPGDTIIVEAGATYQGPFVLPNKSGDAEITIQSSRASEINGRVSPSQSGLLSRLTTSIVEPIISTAAGAHHYHLIGLEISTSTPSDFIYDLLRLGSDSQTSLSTVPHHFILDRLWIHGYPTQPVQRGISLNSGETSVLNSYISDIHVIGADTQAICGWNGPGPYTIVNNYLEAAGENVMFGGAPPAIPNLVPADITMRSNYFFKPLSWYGNDPSYAGIHWGVKNLLELKNARRVVVDGNIFENNWTDGQAGRSIVFTPRPSDSGLAAVIEDVQFTNNIVRNVGSGVLLLGADEAPAPTDTRLRRVRVANNLFENIDGPRFGSNGAFLTVVNGTEDVTVEHNTAIQTGNIIIADYAPNSRFIYSDNISHHNEYGIIGSGHGIGNDSIAYYFANSVINANVMAREGNAPGNVASIYPPGNYFPVSLNVVGFVDLSNGDYRLAPTSPYKGAGTGGTDPGCNIDELYAALNGTTPSPSPTPVPTPDPQSAAVQFSSAQYNVTEGAGAITITVIRNGSLRVTTSVNYATVDVSASNDSDYIGASGTLVFAPGESAKTFTVFITDDTLAEGKETFNVLLADVSNANLGNPATASVVISDNDRLLIEPSDAPHRKNQSQPSDNVDPIVSSPRRSKREVTVSRRLRRQ